MIAREELHKVSLGQLSVARFYGGCLFQGYEYIYEASTDKLIRKDVHKARAKASKAKAKAMASAERNKRADAQHKLI